MKARGGHPERPGGSGRARRTDRGPRAPQTDRAPRISRPAITGTTLLILAISVGAVGAGLVARDYLFKTSAGRIRAVSFPQGEVAVDVAVTEPERRAGLAGREGLPLNGGMLFVYRDTRSRRFTMEGMFFALDIITLDEAGRVLGVGTHDPGEGPFDLGPARYVLEVERGWAAAHGVSPGEMAEFARD